MSENLAVGQVLRDMRKTGNLSQEAFAELVGMQRSDIGQMERGKRTVSIHTLQRISKATGIPMWKIIRRAELQNCTSLAQ